MSFKANIKIKIDTLMPSPDEAGDPAEIEPRFRRSRFTDEGEGDVMTRGGIVTVTRMMVAGTFLEISFSKEDPSIVTIRRGGGEAGTPILLVLEEGVRHICLNSSGDASIEVITTCRKLENNIMKTGRLFADYSVELHGFRVEKTAITLELKKHHTEGN